MDETTRNRTEPGKTEGASETRRLRRLLRQTARVAREASLTGSLEGGARIAARQYNHILEHLQRSGQVPEDLFPRLDENDANIDEVGMVATQLDGYLDDEDGAPEPEHDDLRAAAKSAKHAAKRHDLGFLVGLAPFVPKEQLGELVRAHMVGRDDIDPGLLVALAPFLEGDELGRIIRENLSGWLRAKGTPEPEEGHSEGAPHPPMPPHAPHPPTPPAPPFVPSPPVSEIGAQLQELSDQLRRGDLTNEQRAAVAEQLSRLARTQAQAGHGHTPPRDDKKTAPLQ